MLVQFRIRLFQQRKCSKLSGDLGLELVEAMLRMFGLIIYIHYILNLFFYLVCKCGSSIFSISVKLFPVLC